MEEPDEGGLKDLEERKRREIEHSRLERTILQGFERHSDTNPDEEVAGLQHLIRDPKAFRRHFSNVKFYSVATSSERYYQDWLRERCRGAKALDYCCGNGENAIFAAKCGAEAIGTSPEGIENARVNAIHEDEERQELGISMAFNEEPGYVFYRSGEAAPQAPGIALGADLTCELWKPSFARIRPKGIQSGLPRLRARWLMHYLHLFATRDYSILVIRRGQRSVHHSLVQPKYFRVPALARDDLEITSTWTEPEFRGRGLAAFAIQEIVRRLASPGRHFWYLTRENNLPSIRAAEKGGLVRFAEGKRTRRLGLRILGSFVVHPMR